MTTKVQRQGAVAQLISDHDVTSHTQLVSLLKKSGIVA
ncbi:MAG: Arginine repressor, binding domain, partial [Actinomycetota bacterium]